MDLGLSEHGGYLKVFFCCSNGKRYEPWELGIAYFQTYNHGEFYWNILGSSIFKCFLWYGLLPVGTTDEHPQHPAVGA